MEIGHELIMKQSKVYLVCPNQVQNKCWFIGPAPTQTGKDSQN